MKPLTIGEKDLSLEDVYQVAIDSRGVCLSQSVEDRIQKAHKFLQGEVNSGKTLYGVNTGFGLLSNVQVSRAELGKLQINLVRSHACGVGPAMPDSVSRGMLLLRAHSLAKGFSGVSLSLVRSLVSLINSDVCPIIPQQGSVGASGDLAPLAHLALVLIGEGEARVEGITMSGDEALKKAGIEPIVLGPKEGLALINGTQFICAVGTFAVLEAEYLCEVADKAGALSLEALRGTTRAFDPKIHEARQHDGQRFVAKNLRTLLSDGGSSEISKSHVDCQKVQDPYSLRCMPQVHGASRDLVRFVKKTLEAEINSVTDNPLIFPDHGEIISGGNFHGQYPAMTLDMLSIAIAEIGSISEQRIEKLINPAISDLPSFLTKKGGLNSGFMIVQVSAASIVSENKTLCHPASVDSISTSADKEDHVSMGAWAARKAQRVVTNTRRVLAMELLSALQGVDLLAPLKTSIRLEAIRKTVRNRIPFVDDDRVLSKDILEMDKILCDRLV